MQSEINTSSKITQLRKQLGLSQHEFAKRIGITQGALSQLENQKSTLSLNTIFNISAEFDIDCNWLIMGDSNTIYRNTSEHDVDIHQKRAHGADNLIPLIQEEAHAGYINQSDDVDYINALNAYRIPGFESGDYRMFEIEGDSMMPTIHPREIVVTERVEEWDKIENGTLVVLIAEDGIVAKRFYFHDEQSSYLLLKSDNPIYKTYSLSKQDVREIWEIKAKITNVLHTDLPATQARFNAIESEILELKSKMEQLSSSPSD